MRRGGFTLVELMIVVAIITVLAVIAGTAYRRYMDAGRQSEVYAMFGEFRAKEEAYKAEASTYLTTTAVGENDYWPALLGAGEPTPKYLYPANGGPGLPALWTQLGINPGKNQLYCGYVAVSNQGVAPGAWGLAGARCQSALAVKGAPPGGNWFCLHATCDNDGNSAKNAEYATTSMTTSVWSQNEHN